MRRSFDGPLTASSRTPAGRSIRGITQATSLRRAFIYTVLLFVYSVVGASMTRATPTFRAPPLNEDVGVTLVPLGTLGGGMTGMAMTEGVAWLQLSRKEPEQYLALDLRSLPAMPGLAVVPYDRIGEILAVRNNLLFAAIEAGGHELRVVDVRDPASPVTLGEVSLPGQPDGAVRVEERLFVTIDGAVVAVDVADPIHPVLRGSSPNLGLTPPLATDGHHVFATVNEGPRPDPHAPFQFPRIHVINIDDPDHPQPLSSIELPWRADVHNPARVRQLAWKGGFLLAGTDGYPDGLAVFDMRNPWRPSLRPAVHTGLAHAIVLDGDRLIVIDGTKLRLFDASSPAALRETAKWPVPMAWQHVLDAEMVDGRLVIADAQQGLQLVDLAAPEGPSSVAAYSPPVYAGGLAVRGSLLVVTTGDLVTVDVTDPANPIPRGRLTGRYGNRFVEIQGDFAYTTDYYAGLHVVDLHDPFRPLDRETITSIPSPWRLDVGDGWLYVVGKDGLYSMDLAQPAQPVVIGRLKMNELYSVQLRDGVAYVAGRDGLRVVDITDPAHMRVIGEYGPSWGTSQLEILGHFLTAIFPTSDHGELQVLDVTEPRRPVPVGRAVFRNHVIATGQLQGYQLVGFMDGGKDLEVLEIGPSGEPRTVAKVPNASLSVDSLTSEGDLLFAGMGGILKTFRLASATSGPATPTAPPTALPSPRRLWLPALPHAGP
jgi:hypothetical protein